MTKKIAKDKYRLTPLWIISLFVGLSETILGVGIINTTGEIQIVLTVFMMFFTLLVIGAFFWTLWDRPYVFYSPSEFNKSTNVSSYVNAILQRTELIGSSKQFSGLRNMLNEIQDSISSQFTSQKDETIGNLRFLLMMEHFLSLFSAICFKFISTNSTFVL